MTIGDISGDLPPLKTERLLLRKITEDDVEDLYAHGSDPNVTRHVTWETYQSRADAEDFIDRVLERYKHGKLAPWGIVYREAQRLIGTTAFVSWDLKNRSASLGYALSKPYWNQGFITESTRTVIDFGFQNMNLNRIAARCKIVNVASARVMEKCGMTYEGTQREVVFIKGEFLDLKLYAIVKRDWLAQKEMKTL